MVNTRCPKPSVTFLTNIPFRVPLMPISTKFLGLRVLVPPRMFCERCFVATDEWVYVKDTGTVNTFSLSYLDADANRIKDPILVAVIDIDGASPGIGILHLLGNVNPEKIDVGMKVKAVWKPPEEREGSVTDILFWEPLED